MAPFHNVGMIFTILTLYYCNSVAGSKITLSASSSSVIPLLTPNLTLRCALYDTTASASVIGRSLSLTTNMKDDNQIINDYLSNYVDDVSTTSNQVTLHRSVLETSENAKFVTSVFISLNNNDIASISEHVPARVVSSDQNINVSGGIPGQNEEKGFLEVDIAYPTESQSGNFSCQIHAIDDVGHVVMYSTSAAVNIKEPTTTDLVQYIHKLQLEDINNKAEIVSLQQQNSALMSALDISNHIENGTIVCGELGAGRPDTRSYSAAFRNPYGKVPLVHLAVKDTGFFKGTTSYFNVKLVSSDTKGFKVECSVLSPTYYVNHITISWMSFPQH